MCGIAGFNIHPKDKINAVTLTEALLRGIEHRGPDATGIAWFEPDGQCWIHKNPIPATEFIPNIDMNPDTKVAVLHTRWATTGDPSNNDNNHPIQIGHLVGIHNGVVRNTKEIYTSLDREPEFEVDSAAIYTALTYGNPTLGKSPRRILETVNADAALAWLDVNQPDMLRVARLRNRPLIWTQIGKNGSFIFASTRDALQAGVATTGLPAGTIFEMPVGTYMRIRSAVICETQTFSAWPAPQRNLWKPQHATTTTTRTTHGHTITPVMGCATTPSVPVRNDKYLDLLAERERLEDTLAMIDNWWDSVDADTQDVYENEYSDLYERCDKIDRKLSEFETEAIAAIKLA